MNPNPSPAQTVAAVLARLLTERRELETLVWTVGETPGVLKGHLVASSGSAEVIDVCADLMGGTVVRSVTNRGGDRQGIAHLVTVYDGVPVEVWASYPLPDATGLTYADLHRLMTGRPLGALLCLPGGPQ